MDHVGWMLRLRNRLKWPIKLRYRLPHEVYLDAARHVRLKVRSRETGNFVAWCKQRYGLEDRLLKYEIPETQIFLERVRRASVFYDVGAHIGYYALLAASQPNVRQVVAFEIVDSLAREVRFHAQENALRAITVETMAVGNGQAMIDFGNLIGHARKRSTSLDQYIEGGGPIPDLIKMDIEGHECLALEGAKRTLAQEKPELLLSLHPTYIPQLGSDLQETMGLLKGIYEHVYLIGEDDPDKGGRAAVRLTEVGSRGLPLENCSLVCSSEPLA